MPRPIQYSDEGILKIAAEHFLAHGIAARTIEIAKAAGVSEATLFKRFKTKHALFEAALVAHEQNKTWPGVLLARVGTHTPARNVQEALLALLANLEAIMPRLLALNALGTSSPSRLTPQDLPPVQDAKIFTEYFEAEMKLGRVRMEMPVLKAFQMIGALVQYVFVVEVLGFKVSGKEQYVRTLVSTYVPTVSHRRKAGPATAVHTPKKCVAVRPVGKSKARSAKAHATSGRGGK